MISYGIAYVTNNFIWTTMKQEKKAKHKEFGALNGCDYYYFFLVLEARKGLEFICMMKKCSEKYRTQAPPLFLNH